MSSQQGHSTSRIHCENPYTRIGVSLIKTNKKFVEDWSVFPKFHLKLFISGYALIRIIGVVPAIIVLEDNHSFVYLRPCVLLMDIRKTGVCRSTALSLHNWSTLSQQQCHLSKLSSASRCRPLLEVGITWVTSTQMQAF